MFLFKFKFYVYHYTWNKLCRKSGYVLLQCNNNVILFSTWQRKIKVNILSGKTKEILFLINFMMPHRF